MHRSFHLWEHVYGYDENSTEPRNQINKGGMANTYNAIMPLADDLIVATVDGDDWLPTNDVLKHLNEVYQDQNVWLTYGQFRRTTRSNSWLSEPFPSDVIQKRSFRSYPWVSKHLRTFYAGLFKRIAKKDMMKDGKFFTVGWDLAFMFPMLEMAGSRIRFIPKILYVYNDRNPIGDAKIRRKEQLIVDEYMRKKKKYPLLRSLF